VPCALDANAAGRHVIANESTGLEGTRRNGSRLTFPGGGVILSAQTAFAAGERFGSRHLTGDIVHTRPASPLDEASRVVPLAPATNDEGAKPVSSDFASTLAVLRRRWRLIALSALLFMLLGGLAGLLLPPRYTAVAEIAIGGPSARLAKVEDLIGELTANADTIQNEVEILESRMLARRVSERLELNLFPEFNPEIEDPEGPPDVRAYLAAAKEWTLGWVSRAAAAVGVPLPKETELGDEAGGRTAVDDVVDRVLTHLYVEPQGHSQVISIAFDAREPALAATVANAFAEEYLEDRVESRQTAAADVGGWLGERIETLRKEVHDKQAAAERFRQEAGLIEGVNASLKAESLSELGRELVVARAALSTAQSRYLEATRAAERGQSEAISDVLLSRTIQDLREQEGQIAAEVARLQSEYGERHPRMTEASRRLAQTRAQIRLERDRILESMLSEVEAARARVEAIDTEVGKLEQELRDQSASEAQLRVLEREAEASDEVFRDFLTQSTTAAGMSHGGAGNDGRLISVAAPPAHPSPPSTKLLALLGLLVGCFTGAAAAFGFEMVNHRYRSAAEVERSLNLSVLGVLPLVGSLPWAGFRQTPEGYVVDEPTSPFAETLRGIEARLVRGVAGPRAVTVMVSSAFPGEGKSSLALALGRRAAIGGRRVLLVDADSRLGRVHTYFGVGRSPGLDALVFANQPASESLRTDQATGMQFIPCGEPRDEMTHGFAELQIARCLGRLALRFDLIIVDTPPVLPVYDACALASEVDRIILVVDWSLNERAGAQAAAARIRSAARHAQIGVVLNKVNLRAAQPQSYPEIAVYGGRYRKYYQPRSR
jgi:polysaccharide biosynthesis transport protein